MKKTFLIWLLATIFLATVPSAQAQQPAKIPRIGVLTRDLHPADSRAPAAQFVDAFRDGLRALGYIENKSIFIEYRYAEGRFERVPTLAEELVRLQVQVIVVDSFTTARPVRKVTTTIPIVVASGANPIGSGLVASLARPGGNVTGLVNNSVELLGKRLELLKEVLPKVSSFAFLNDPEAEASKSTFDEARLVAKALGATIRLVEVQTPNPDLDGAFRLMAKERIGAVATSPSPRLNLAIHRKKIIGLLEQARLPAMHPLVSWMDIGGMMYYGANNFDLYRRAATYVDKILKGRMPPELPVEQPMKFDFVINLQAAKKIGVTIPPNVLVRADRVIR